MYPVIFFEALRVKIRDEATARSTRKAAMRQFTILHDDRFLRPQR
jgi:hypothetical protein